MASIVLTALNAVGEELAFRGFLLGGLERRCSRCRANVIAALVFVLVHVPGWCAMGRPAIGLLISALLLSVLALMLGWLAQRTGSIWLPAVVHPVNNVVGS